MAKRPAGGARLTRRFERALVYATKAHRKQKRKGTRIPYVGHLLGVAALVIEDGGSQDQAIAALLHDVVEDQGGTARLADIRARFGRQVARIVVACSDSETDDPRQKRPWLERKQDYLDHLRQVPASVLRVSAADKLYNARAILADYRILREKLWGRFNPEAGRDNILWYYRSLVKIFSKRAPGPLTDELRRTVAELHTLVPAARKNATP